MKVNGKKNELLEEHFYDDNGDEIRKAGEKGDEKEDEKEEE